MERDARSGSPAETDPRFGSPAAADAPAGERYLLLADISGYTGFAPAASRHDG